MCCISCLECIADVCLSWACAQAAFDASFHDSLHGSRNFDDFEAEEARDREAAELRAGEAGAEAQAQAAQAAPAPASVLTAQAAKERLADALTDALLRDLVAGALGGSHTSPTPALAPSPPTSGAATEAQVSPRSSCNSSMEADAGSDGLRDDQSGQVREGV